MLGLGFCFKKKRARVLVLGVYMWSYEPISFRKKVEETSIGYMGPRTKVWKSIYAKTAYDAWRDQIGF